MTKGHITIDRELCKGCQLCVAFCPRVAIDTSEDLNAAGYQAATFNSAAGCTACAICALVCPEVAIEVYRD